MVLSTSKGIVHPYYVSALAPGVGAMSGLGIVALARLARGPHRAIGIGLSLLAIAATVGVESVLMHRMGYRLWFIPILLVGAGAGAVALLRQAEPGRARARVHAAGAARDAGGLLRIHLAGARSRAPSPPPAPNRRRAWAATASTGPRWRSTGRWSATTQSHRPGTRWPMLTVASDTAAPMILMGLHAGAIGGYSGTDPTLTGAVAGTARARRQGPLRAPRRQLLDPRRRCRDRRGGEGLHAS